MLIKVRVRAGAKNESLTKNGDVYAISLREKAEGGMANARMLALLADTLGTSSKKLRIIKGHRSPAKTIERLP